MRIFSVILLVFLKIIFIETFCVRDCDSSEFMEVCARRPNSDVEVVIKNRCLLNRQICYDTEFGSATYTYLHDGGCKRWDGWTIEEYQIVDSLSLSTLRCLHLGLYVYMANHYEVPSWAGKAPQGNHLDVTKDDKLIQKLMIDEKKCYLFGRNPQLNDFCIDHSSCSRVHAAYVYHKHLNISYLVDLGSTHGTFIGTLQIEPHKPTQLHINSTFHFGASTRYYTLRERPVAGSRSSNNIMEDIPMTDMSDGSFLIPETQMELDNLTEYNTAHNRRISMLGITDDNNVKKSASKKKKRRSVTFNEEEIVINPEDINPAIGRFRNLIQTTVVPAKRIKLDNAIGVPTSSDLSKHMHPNNFIPQLYEDLPPAGGESSKMDTYPANIDNATSITNLGSKLGILFPNPAPEVAPTVSESEHVPTQMVQPSHHLVNSGNEHEHMSENLSEPKKKKYAKEAWPGRKPLLNSF